MYFESHAHYDDKRFREDREKLLELLPSCGIDHVVNIGCDLKSSKESIRLAENMTTFTHPSAYTLTKSAK